MGSLKVYRPLGGPDKVALFAIRPPERTSGVRGRPPGDNSIGGVRGVVPPGDYSLVAWDSQPHPFGMIRQMPVRTYR